VTDATKSADASLPRHVAVIMDGNGRWAKARSRETTFGHEKGVEVVEKILDHAAERGIAAMTLYAFSSENWSRPDAEKKILFKLLKVFFTQKINKIIAKNARLKMIGDLSKFSADIQELMAKAESDSKNNTGCFIQIALSYGGRDEIVRASKKMATEVASGKIKIDDITEDSFKTYLDTSEWKQDPDLLIRTGGDLRISNFLLYQVAYTELYFTKTLWPDFSPEEFDKAILEYQSRERRFGGRKC
jgi:undecaprenyl diphosphate synthase